MAGKCRMAGRFRVDKTGADLIVLCTLDPDHDGDHGDGHGRTWPQTTEVGERPAINDLDLDAVRSAMAEAMHKADCACGATMAGDHHTPDVPGWYTDLADAALSVVRPELQRLQALQRRPLWMCEGGEVTVYRDVDALLARRQSGDPKQPPAPRAVASDAPRTEAVEGHPPHGPGPEAYAPSQTVAGQETP